MAFGLIIIGDEILSGKRRDRHFPAVIEMLKKRGMQLDWAEYLSDDPVRIEALLKRIFATEDIVFSCGGIGGTPDDHTRQCVAAALQRPLKLHPEAKALIYERIRDVAHQHGRQVDLDAPDNVQRLKMGEFPEGARIIPNPVNKIPGFSVGTHYFFPGFPEMAHPMMEWVLETYHQQDFFRSTIVEKSSKVYGAVEALLTPLMEAVEDRWPNVRIFSLPHIPREGTPGYVELGVKGAEPDLSAAFDELLNQLDALDLHYERLIIAPV